jgi:hypothetical protein
VKEDVIGFEVAVHDIAFVKDLEGLKELLENEQGIFFLNEALLTEHGL